MNARWSVLGVTALLFSGAATVQGAPTLRRQMDLRGDFALIGNTLGWDCGVYTPAIPRPIVGTVPLDCGLNLDDSAPDALWRSDEPEGGATASASRPAAEARSTAVLTLPVGARVTYARLYWAAMKASAGADLTASLDRPGVGGFSANITADGSFVLPEDVNFVYQSTADITDLVKLRGIGAYRMSGVEIIDPANRLLNTMFAAWAMVVFYELDGEPQRNLAIFDGLDRVNGTTNRVQVSLKGFLVPSTGFDGKLGLIAYEGDQQATGDFITFNGTLVWDAVNATTNFFNGTRSWLGKAVTVAGDLPQLTGTASSYSGVDLDVVDVTKLLTKGQTQAEFVATSEGDYYLLGAFVTSISSLTPEFSGASTKTVRDVTTPNGPVRPGDEVEYTIVVKNAGNDTAVNAVLNDTLPAGLSYKPGSLRITAGPNVGIKTDAAGDDQGEYNAATRTVRVLLGTGATALQGGTMQIGDTTTVLFRATIDLGASGTLLNQGTIVAAGLGGNPATEYKTDGNGGGSGTPATPLPIDECGIDTDCPMAKPFCLTSNDPNICVACRTAVDCPLANPVCSAATRTCVPVCGGDVDCALPTPACLSPAGICVGCTAANKTGCQGVTLACNVATNKCVECIDATTCPMGSTCNVATKSCVGCTDSSQCAATRPVCDGGTKMCRACAGDNECLGPTLMACTASGACGECSATNKTKCVGTTPLCDVMVGKCVGCLDNTSCLPTVVKPVCDNMARSCRACANDGECVVPTQPACQPSGGCDECSATNRTRCPATRPACNVMSGKCVECATATDCPAARPVCTAMNTCAPCRSDAECPLTAPACQADGRCAECSATNKVRCMGMTPFCDVALAKCTACLADGDCPASTPWCHPMSRTCVACDSDGPPSCNDRERPACQRAGMLAGACTECSMTFAGRCMGTRPSCLTDLGLCGCTDVDGDSECGTMLSGIVCNGRAGACIPGCSTAAGRNRCPAGQMCSRTDGQVGTCIGAQACLSNTDCSQPRPICDTVANPRGCVQCLQDTQCSGGLVCADTTLKACVECTETKVQNCQTAQAGRRCLTTNTCGCQADADCPGAGRVCDMQSQKCSVGCRGIGGLVVVCQVGTDAGVRNDAAIVVPARDASNDGVAADAPVLPPRVDAPIGASDSAMGDARPATNPDVLVDRDAARFVAADGATDGRFDTRSDGMRSDGSGLVRGYVGGGGCACDVGAKRSSPTGMGILILALALGIRQRRRRGEKRP